MKLLYLYISKQFIKSFFLLISIFSLVVISSQMLHLPKFVYSMNLIDFLGIILLLDLSFAKLQILFGFLIAWLLTGIRIRESNEIYAIYSLGISKADMIKPVILWGLFFSILALLFSTVISPYTNRERAKFLTVKVRSYLLDSIQPESFSKISDNIYIYVGKKEDSNFSRIIIQNLSNGFLVTAKKGYFSGDFVILEDGYIQIPSEDSYSIMNFKRYSFNIDISYKKEIALEDIKTTELIKMLQGSNPERQKVFAVLTDRFVFPIPFLIAGIISFLSGVSFYRSKEMLLLTTILGGMGFILLNYFFIKLIEKTPIGIVIYPVILLTLMIFTLKRIYKSR